MGKRKSAKTGGKAQLLSRSTEERISHAKTKQKSRQSVVVEAENEDSDDDDGDANYLAFTKIDDKSKSKSKRFQEDDDDGEDEVFNLALNDDEDDDDEDDDDDDDDDDDEVALHEDNAHKISVQTTSFHRACISGDDRINLMNIDDYYPTSILTIYRPSDMSISNDDHILHAMM